MKNLLFALLLGVSSVAVAAGNGVKSPTVHGVDARKYEVLVPAAAEEDDTITMADFDELKDYSGIVTEENVKALQAMVSAGKNNPSDLVRSFGPANLDIQVSDEDIQAAMKRRSSDNDLIARHKEALAQLERVGRKQLNTEQKAPIMMVPTVEEIKKLGLDKYLPDNWEEALSNSEEYQKGMKQRESMGVGKLDDPETLSKMMEQLKSSQQ